jgi:abhydrolase domain-containing protein 17
MEYSGYSIYSGKTSSEIIKADAEYIYQYFVKKIGFKEENIIVVGRSIGTGIALDLMRAAKPRVLALISSFSGIKSLAKEFAGKFGTLIAKETYDNISNIE